jgi:hypothetical protein
VREVVGDRYSEELIRERFRTHGVRYEVSHWTKSDLYVELLPLLTSRRARLLDQPRLMAQLLALERRTGASGRDAISHPREARDDVANAAAGALVHLGRRGQPGFSGWKPYMPVPESVPARPVSGTEVIEPRWYSCPNRCGAKPVSRPRPDPAVSLASVARSATRDLSSISRRRSGTAKTSPVWAAVGRHMTQAGGGRIVSLDLGLQNKGSP